MTLNQRIGIASIAVLPSVTTGNQSLLKHIQQIKLNSMTDKEKIRNEIEKLKAQLIRGACSSQIAMETRCKEEAYNEVLTILDTLQEEPVCEELEKNEQKPWSEEDEDRLISCIEGIEACYKWDSMVDWLKSLKDRVQPQPKQEWSEEDEKKRKRIMHRLSIDGTINNKDLADINDWLKSLRPKWKPSEYHLGCITDAISMYKYRGINAIGLKEVLDELKKLK